MTDQANLLEAMAQVGCIEKDGKVNFGNTKYAYMSEQAVKLACQKAFLEAGVMPTSVGMEVLWDEWLKINGKEHNMVKIRATITFGRGDDLCTYQGIASSSDKGDKATMQAQTGALREALKNLFIIPSGTDPEEYHPEKEGNAPAKKAATGSKEGPVSPGQKREIWDVAQKKGFNAMTLSQLGVKVVGTAVAEMTEGEGLKLLMHLEGLPDGE